jgi:hypothetical protein
LKKLSLPINQFTAEGLEILRNALIMKNEEGIGYNTTIQTIELPHDAPKELVTEINTALAENRPKRRGRKGKKKGKKKKR